MSEGALRLAVAEAIGAFTLTFIGAGAAAAAGGVHDPTLIGVAIANGLAIGVMVCALGPISGGHFNPAVTFGFLVARKIKPGRAVVYWIAQLAGAALAALWFAICCLAKSPKRSSSACPRSATASTRARPFCSKRC